MTTEEGLDDLRVRLLEAIGAAAAENNLPRVARLSSLASECEALIKERHALTQRVGALIATFEGYESAEDPPPDVKPSIDFAKAMSPKAAGGEARRSWIAELETEGISVTGHGKRFHSGSGKTISIGFANELPHLKDRWWLGFRDEPTDIAVLLCHTLERHVHAFVIPVVDLGGAWRLLSRSRGQLKFNVRKDGTRFLLLVPGSEAIDITQYDRNYAPLADAA